ncbi:hypothetical protein QTP70_021495, partial [Hemibagrus guttatus]
KETATETTTIWTACGLSLLQIAIFSLKKMNFGKFLPSASSFRGVACAAGLLAVTSAGYWAYRRLKRRSRLPAADPQPAQGAVADVEVVEDVQVTEPICQLRPLNSTLRRQLSSCFHATAVLVSCTSLGVTSGFSPPTSTGSPVSDSRTSEVLHPAVVVYRQGDLLRSFGASNSTTCEDSFTPLYSESLGARKKPVSCRGLETVLYVPHEGDEQTCNQVRCAHLPVGVDDQVDTSHLEEEERSFTPRSDMDIESDFEESNDDLSPEESEVPFISSHLWLEGVTDVALKLPAIREAFSRMLGVHPRAEPPVRVREEDAHASGSSQQKGEKWLGVQLAYDSVIQFPERAIQLGVDRGGAAPGSAAPFQLPRCVLRARLVQLLYTQLAASSFGWRFFAASVSSHQPVGTWTSGSLRAARLFLRL